MKKALIILHQKRSITGDIGNKLKARGYSLDIRRPCCGDSLPVNLDNHALVVILGGPISVNDDCEYKDYEIAWLKIVLESNKPFLSTENEFLMMCYIFFARFYLKYLQI